MTDDFSSGAALSFALVSVDSLEASIAFYADVIGLTAGPIRSTICALADDDGLERQARTALLGEPGLPIGRILLVEFAQRGQPVRRRGDRTTRGFWNLNFYVDDIAATTRALKARGLEFWADPETYQVGVNTGSATEVVFEGPDSVAINLVTPHGEADTLTGRTRAAVARHGKTRTGFTPVATTGHCLRDVAAALRFYREVLGMHVVIDEILGKPETNRFLARPANARSRTVFVAGAHFYGKVALNEPQNFEVPDRVVDAHAPNVGYLAQGFDVPSLDEAAQRLRSLGVPHELRSFPQVDGLPSGSALQLRIPGSGGYAVLIESGRST